jgi:hypothetical protein
MSILVSLKILQYFLAMFVNRNFPSFHTRVSSWGDILIIFVCIYTAMRFRDAKWYSIIAWLGVIVCFYGSMVGFIYILPRLNLGLEQPQAYIPISGFLAHIPLLIFLILSGFLPSRTTIV